MCRVNPIYTYTYIYIYNIYTYRDIDIDLDIYLDLDLDTYRSRSRYIDICVCMCVCVCVCVRVRVRACVSVCHQMSCMIAADRNHASLPSGIVPPFSTPCQCSRPLRPMQSFLSATPSVSIPSTPSYVFHAPYPPPLPYVFLPPQCIASRLLRPLLYPPLSLRLFSTPPYVLPCSIPRSTLASLYPPVYPLPRIPPLLSTPPSLPLALSPALPSRIYPPVYPAPPVYPVEEKCRTVPVVSLFLSALG